MQKVLFRILEAVLSISVSLFLSLGDFALSNDNVTAQSSVQLTVLYLKESKYQLFPSPGQTVSNCHFKENRSPKLKWQELNRIEAKYLRELCYSASLHGLVLYIFQICCAHKKSMPKKKQIILFSQHLGVIQASIFSQFISN